MLNMNELIGFGWAVKPPPSIVLAGTYLVADTDTSFTATGIAIGVEGDRSLVITAFADCGLGTSPSITGLTVDGVAATQLVHQATATTSLAIAIYIIDKPVGSTANITFTTDSALFRGGIIVHAAYDLDSLVARDTAKTGSTSSNSLNASIDVLSDGVIVCAASANAALSVTWTGATETVDTIYATQGLASMAVHSSPSGETNRSITSAFSGTERVELAMVSLR